MNLHIDVILETEQRSGSVLNRKSLTRMGIILGPSALILLAASLVFNMLKAQNELRMLEDQWLGISARIELAETIHEQIEANRDIIKELNGWRASHMDWHLQLLALQQSIPSQVQLTSLKISQALQIVEDKFPARMFVMSLEGRATGKTTDQDVQSLRNSLSQLPAFTNEVETVEVAAYGADTAKDAAPEDRVFRIDCKYRARRFK